MTQYIHHGVSTLLESFLAGFRKKKRLLYTEMSYAVIHLLWYTTKGWIFTRLYIWNKKIFEVVKIQKY